MHIPALFIRRQDDRLAMWPCDSPETSRPRTVFFKSPYSGTYHKATEVELTAVTDADAELIKGAVKAATRDREVAEDLKRELDEPNRLAKDAAPAKKRVKLWERAFRIEDRLERMKRWGSG